MSYRSLIEVLEVKESWVDCYEDFILMIQIDGETLASPVRPIWHILDLIGHHSASVSTMIR